MSCITQIYWLFKPIKKCTKKEIPYCKRLKERKDVYEQI